MNRNIHYIYIIALLLLMGVATTVHAQTIQGNVYGGGNFAQVEGSTTINIKSGEITILEEGDGNIYGGGYGASAVLTGSTTINVTGGTISKDVYGGGALANVTGSTEVNINGGTVTQDVYGGGALAIVSANTSVNLTGGIIRNSYGGGLGQLADAGAGKEAIAATVTGDANVTVSGGTTTNVFGCNNLNGSPKGGVTVTIQDDANVTNVYGGGNQAAASVSPVVNINGGTSDKVYGGGYGATAVLTGNPTVNVSDGTVAQDVYGGGALADVDGSPTVNISGGTVVHDVYGGGALADVDGSTTVNLTGGAVGGAYGGALGQLEDKATGKEAIAAKVNGNTTVMLNRTQITETGVFGCNNLNGTPRGHAFVHVLKTAPRDGAAYDVPAVYGGGNLSAYEPTAPTEYAEVLIENCDNSIEYVYGGGNAAPVPATKVTIYGANAINHAFAGGNGAGQSTDPDAANYNPGADVGYLGYHSKGSDTEYGTGKASITVYGGTVHNVYGGSNTLGFIRGGTSVSVANKDGACPLNVGNVFGGGNKADINCDVTMDLDCSEGGTILYAGANNADVNGSITLNIHSGTYGKVFCGNNTGGAVKGKLTVNVDETGCWPIMIGELYGGGNEAGYSVYGYEVDGEGKTLREDGNVVVKTGGDRLYGDPEVNLYSFTRIGKVFGGGYGETAVLYGNTHVNVEPIPGIYSDGTARPAFVLNQDDERVRNDANSTVADVLGTDRIGSIGTIYGGGNAGAVYGNTEVNIGTKAKNHHISGGDQTTEEEVAVTITGNVFGGGNEAIVSGDTKVTIGD